MLNKKEVAVMRAVYDVCKRKNDSCIITDEFIIQSAPEKFKLNPTLFCIRWNTPFFLNAPKATATERP